MSGWRYDREAATTVIGVYARVLVPMGVSDNRHPPNVGKDKGYAGEIRNHYPASSDGTDPTSRTVRGEVRTAMEQRGSKATKSTTTTDHIDQ